MNTLVKDNNELEVIMAKRFLFSVYSTIANYVTIHHKDNIVASGILYSMDMKSGSMMIKNYILEDDITHEVTKMKVIKISDIKYMSAKDLGKNKKRWQLEALKKKGHVNQGNFETDKEVGSYVTKTERHLVKWDDSFFDEPLESKKTKVIKPMQGVVFESGTELGTNKEDIKDFDQFKTNKEMFGLEDNFDMNNYTTKQNLNDFSAEQIRKAERMAKEIECSDNFATNTNRHLLEERNIVKMQDYDAGEQDEEDLYSAVTNDPILNAVERNPQSLNNNKNKQANQKKDQLPMLTRGTGLKPKTEANLNSNTSLTTKHETPLRKLRVQQSESFYPSNMSQFNSNVMMPAQPGMQVTDPNVIQSNNGVATGQPPAPVIEKSKAITPALLEQKKAEAAEKSALKIPQKKLLKFKFKNINAQDKVKIERSFKSVCIEQWEKKFSAHKPPKPMSKYEKPKIEPAKVEPPKTQPVQTTKIENDNQTTQQQVNHSTGTPSNLLNKENSQGSSKIETNTTNPPNTTTQTNNEVTPTSQSQQKMDPANTKPLSETPNSLNNQKEQANTPSSNNLGNKTSTAENNTREQSQSGTTQDQNMMNMQNGFQNFGFNNNMMPNMQFGFQNPMGNMNPQLGLLNNMGYGMGYSGMFPSNMTGMNKIMNQMNVPVQNTSNTMDYMSNNQGYSPQLVQQNIASNNIGNLTQNTNNNIANQPQANNPTIPNQTVQSTSEKNIPSVETNNISKPLNNYDAFMSSQVNTITSANKPPPIITNLNVSAPPMSNTQNVANPGIVSQNNNPQTPQSENKTNGLEINSAGKNSNSQSISNQQQNAQILNQNVQNINNQQQSDQNLQQNAQSLNNSQQNIQTLNNQQQNVQNINNQQQTVQSLNNQTVQNLNNQNLNLQQNFNSLGGNQMNNEAMILMNQQNQMLFGNNAINNMQKNIGVQNQSSMGNNNNHGSYGNRRGGNRQFNNNGGGYQNKYNRGGKQNNFGSNSNSNMNFNAEQNNVNSNNFNNDSMMMNNNQHYNNKSMQNVQNNFGNSMNSQQQGTGSGFKGTNNMGTMGSNVKNKSFQNTGNNPPS